MTPAQNTAAYIKGFEDGERATKAKMLRELENQEPVGWMFEDSEDNGHKTFQSTPPSLEAVTYLAKWNRPTWMPLYTHPPQRKKVVFPTMLRKMWSGSEVQAWLDENVNKENKHD